MTDTNIITDGEIDIKLKNITDMINIPDIKPRFMTPEQKNERKRMLQREYMAKRRAEDPEFKARQLELNRTRKLYLYHNDEEYKKKQQERLNKRNSELQKYKTLYEELLESSKV